MPRQVQQASHTVPEGEMATSTIPAALAHQPAPSELQEPRSNGDETPREDGTKVYGMARVLSDMFEPVVWIEKKTIEPLAAWLSRLALLDVLEYLGKLAILVVLIVWLFEADDRTREEHYEAWRVINSAQGQEGTGGRIEALQNLYGDGQ